MNSSTEIVIAYRIRKAKRKAKALNLTPLQTQRLIEAWKKQGAK